MIGQLERTPPAQTSAEVTASVLTGVEEFLSTEAIWKDLYESSRTQNPFLCWEWVSTWVEHFCGDKLRTIVVREGDRVIAIAPFYFNRYLIGPGLYASALQLMGPKEMQHLFEIREALVLPGHQEVALNAILDRVVALPGCDWIELSAQADAQAVLEHALFARNRAGLTALPGPVVQMPVMRLERNWEEQRRKLKRNVKESIRHCYNSLRRDGLDYAYVSDAAASGSVSAAERLVKLHHHRSLVENRLWHRDHFADDPVRRFEVEALRRLHSAGHARFAEISINENVVASRACLESHGALYFYYSGFDPAWWKYSVMTLLVTEAIRDGIERGLEIVNFSPGLDPSKSRWNVTTTPIQTITILHSNPAARMRYRLLLLRKKIRQPLHRQLERVLGLFRRRGQLPRETE